MLLTESKTVTITITGIDLLALKKLTLISYVLAEKIGGAAGQEQASLAGILEGLVRQMDLAALGARSEGQP